MERLRGLIRLSNFQVISMSSIFDHRNVKIHIQRYFLKWDILCIQAELFRASVQLFVQIFQETEHRGKLQKYLMMQISTNNLILI